MRMIRRVLCARVRSGGIVIRRGVSGQLVPAVRCLVSLRKKAH